jgi:glutamate-1-semialdehyde 2,1-aminomutase
VKPDSVRLCGLMALERLRAMHAGLVAQHDRAPSSLLASGPMQWMVHWACGFPVDAERAGCGRLIHTDGHEYGDFCLGDFGVVPGHSPAVTVAAVIVQAARGTTFMLPNEDAMVVGEQLSDQFGMPAWQFTSPATDVDRAFIRHSRGLTGRIGDRGQTIGISIPPEMLT